MALDSNGNMVSVGSVVENPATGLRVRITALDGLVGKAEWVSGPGRDRFEQGGHVEFGRRPNQCGWVICRGYM